jgi:hypothetical protein
MNAPALSILEHFGNELVYQQKLAGGVPLFSRIFGDPIAREQQRAEEERLLRVRAEAELMNLKAREARENRLRSMEERVRHTRMPIILHAGMVGGPHEDEHLLDEVSGPIGERALTRGPRLLRGDQVPLGFDEGMVRIASAIGRTLAHADFEELEKNAAIGPLLARVVGGAGRALGSAGAGLAKLRAPKPGVPAMPSLFGRNTSSAGLVAPPGKPGAVGGLTAARMSRARVRPNLPQPQLPPPRPAGAGAPPPRIESDVKTMRGMGPPAVLPPPPAPAAPPVPAAASASPGAVSPPASPPAASSGVAPTPVATPAAPAAPAATPAAPRKSMGLGWKLPLLGAVGLGSYGLYKGTQGATNLLSQEPPEARYGGYSPASGINQYGVPVRM